MELTQMIERIRERLPEKRFVHSLGVMEEMERIGPLCGADPYKAKIAAILHDVTKALSVEEQKELFEKYRVSVSALERLEPKLWHALTGAAVAKEEFGVTDPEILDAIRYHTTAKADMSPLALALYLSDYTEPNRDYPGVEELRKEIYADVHKGLLIALDFSITDVVGKGGLLHPDTVEARNFELMRSKK